MHSPNTTLSCQLMNKVHKWTPWIPFTLIILHQLDRITAKKKVYTKYILRGWAQRQQETLYPYTRGLLHG